MYDASLDQFKPHNWSSLDVWPNYNNYNRWSGIQNFTLVQSRQRWWNEEYIQQKEKRYDRLLYGGDYYGDGIGIRGRQSMTADAKHIIL